MKQDWRELTALAAHDRFVIGGELDEAKVKTEIELPVNEQGEVCVFPWDTLSFRGAPMGQYHCLFCGASVLAGVPHPNYAEDPDREYYVWEHSPQGCPDAPHRGPQGPNEDLAQCPKCLQPSHALRPVGETFGQHAPDCSLEERHEGYCVGGGAGHPVSEVERG